MKLDLKALSLTSGILWALALFLTGIFNLIWPGYGEAFLRLMASIYPGYHAAHSLGDLIVGTLYAFLDGVICGFVFGLLYNLFLRKGHLSKP
jgi:ABC-type nitrate/sulfonate/bicarbonate transport system permease component